MNWLVDKVVGVLGINGAALFIAVVTIGVGFTLGYTGASARLQKELAQERQAWAEERSAATAQALAESEAQRKVERAFAEQLSAALKDYDDEKNQLATVRARADRADRRLRDARAAITAALNRQEWTAAAPCFRAADTTLAALGGCAEAYRDVAHRYGECLAGMQMIEKTWNAARDVCR